MVKGRLDFIMTDYRSVSCDINSNDFENFRAFADTITKSKFFTHRSSKEAIIINMSEVIYIKFTPAE